MNYDEAMNMSKVEFGQMPPQAFLLGLLSAFDNRYQASADKYFQEITWKQFFAIICINMCKEPPTLKELSDVLGSSHQNVKQILLKLEKKSFIQFQTDDADKRKQRIVLTDYCREFCERNDEMSKSIMEKMFDEVTEKEVTTTIQTIIKIEKNLRRYEG
jgi:DNA-binding MarR family transcriptional regulator